ncbi:MAG: PQQ-binding-like beta-propeller repeat protein [Ignavibacteriales bacterium]|nr:PQQ-binding-like beta-propeller repeat protein [Ignavibacteriales bacterium]
MTNRSALRRGLMLVLVLVIFTGTSLFAGTSGQKFRFAWLTDTHVGSGTGADDLRASVKDINSRRDIEFVLVSGDVTELGRTSQLQLAKQILDSLTVPCHIIPGNHDTKWSESGATVFPRLWGADRFVFDAHGYRFVGLHQGPIMRMGDGHFAPEDLRWLDSTLRPLQTSRQPLIFVTHYPLDESIDNWYDAIAMLKKCNTQVVLLGHGHSNEIMNFEGLPGIMSRANLRGGKCGAGYTIGTIRNDSLICEEKISASDNLRRWHGLLLQEHAFAGDTTHYGRPDFALNVRYPDVHAVWEYQTHYTIAASPAVWNDRVIFADRSGTVTCLSLKDGSPRWKFNAGSAVFSSPAVSDGKVLFGATDSMIYCLAVKNGKVLWKVHTGAPVVASPCIEGGTAYIGAGDGAFRAIDVASGSARWTFKDVESFVEDKPLFYQNKIYFGSWDSYLYALDATTGTLAWKWSNGTGTLNLSPAACWPVGSNGRVFIVAPDRAMTAIDAETGKQIWRSKRHQVREEIGISEDGSRIYAKCMNDTLFAFSAAAPGQQTVWATHCGYGYNIDASMIREKEGTVFFGTKNGRIFALDASSGTIKWAHRTGVSIISTPTPIDSNRVVITTFDGIVTLLEKQLSEKTKK